MTVDGNSSNRCNAPKNSKVVYKAQKDACRAFADPQGDRLGSGPKRNSQILSPLDFLAEFTQHIPWLI